MSIKDTVKKIDEYIDQLVKSAEKEILQDNFEFVKSDEDCECEVDLTATTLDIEIDGVIFQIWNANDPKNTYVYNIKSATLERMFMSAKFSNPDAVRNKLRGDIDDFERKRLQREMAQIQAKLDVLEG